MPQPLKQLITLVFLITGADCFAQAPVSFNDTLLYGGCWFVPHNAGVNIQFTPFSNFTFHDYEAATGKELTHTGKYLLDGHNLWLLYNDRPKQKLYFYKGTAPDNNYYIKGYPLKTSPYYFVHGQCD